MSNYNSEHYHDPTASIAVARADKYYENIRRQKEMENKIIAVDFDGVIVSDEYPKIGKPIYDAIKKLKDLSKNNTLILWTCRNNEKLDEALSFCEKHGLKFDYVNENADETLKKYDYIDSRKITADIYIDDKSRISI